MTGTVPIVQRLMLRAADSPLKRPLAAAHGAIARLAGWYLVRGIPGASVYSRGSLGGAEFVPGLSDVDLAVLVPAKALSVVERRWLRVRSALPRLIRLIDMPRIHSHEELEAIAGQNAFTYGLGTSEAAGFVSARVRRSARRQLGRPGLYGPTSDWRPILGSDRRPREPGRDRHATLVAGWLELAYWWRWAFRACVLPAGPRTVDMAAKLVIEPARIWLWLAHGERAELKQDVVRRALAAMPEEADALDRARRLAEGLRYAGDPQMREAVRAMLRLSQRVANRIADEIAGDGTTDVRLVGDAGEVVLTTGDGDIGGARLDGRASRILPLADWRSVVDPAIPDESFVLLGDAPDDPAVLAAVSSTGSDGPRPALTTGDLLLFPGDPLVGTRLRSLQSPFSDPVSFALMCGDDVARYPAVRGWSVADWAGRATCEHRDWLVRGGGSATGLRELGLLLTAARAALLLESVEEGDPALALTTAAAATRLAERHPRLGTVAESAFAAYRDAVANLSQPSARIVAAMRSAVLGLPPYAASSTTRSSTASRPARTPSSHSRASARRAATV